MTHRAPVGIVLIALTGCSSPPRDAVDAGPGEVRDAARSDDAPGDATIPRADTLCDGGASAGDAAAAPTTPDPDDSTCLLPSPQPLACVTACAPERKSALNCERLPVGIGIGDAYGIFPRADALGVYWVSYGHLQWQPTGATRATRYELAYVGDEMFAVDEDAVYFGSPADSGEVTLSRVKRDGSARTSLAQVAPGSFYALDRSSIYFDGIDGKVASVPKAGGPPVDVGIRDVGARSLQMDDTHFYWVAPVGAEHVVQRMAKETTTLETIGTGIGRIEWMKLLSDHLVLFANGAFLTLSKEGGCPRVLAVPTHDARNRLHAIDANEDGIYWLTAFTSTDSPTYELWRTPRWGEAVVSLYGGSSQPGLLTITLGPSLLLLKLDGMLFKLERR